MNNNLNCTIDFVLIEKKKKVKDILLAGMHETSLNVFDLQPEDRFF